MQSMQILCDNSNIQKANWKHVKSKNKNRPRRDVVGRGEAELEVKTVSKYISLYVSRLNPNTNQQT